MRKILLLVIILTLPIWVYSQATPPNPERLSLTELMAGSPGPPEYGEMIPFKPALSMSDALVRAEEYVKEKKVDVSGQYVHSVQLYYDDGSKRKGHYWRVQWMGSTPRLGMEYALRIYMDGAVIPDPTGP